MDEHHVNHEQLYRTPLHQKCCVRCGRDPALVLVCLAPLLQKCNHCDRLRHECVPMPPKLFLMANVLLETAQQIRDEGLPLQDHLARYCKRFDAIATTYLVAEGKKGRGGRTKGKAVDTDSAPLLLREQVATTDALRDVANQLRWLNGFEMLDAREQQFPRDFVLSNTPTSTHGERVMRLDPARDMRGIEDDEANDYHPPIPREDDDEDA